MWLCRVMLVWALAAKAVAVGNLSSAVDSRAGCDCDCSWAAHGCGRPDGSCCYNKCCGGPGPAPGPAPGPVGPGTDYCPDTSQDFQQDYPGGVSWSGSGWTIHGSGRASSKASFDLRGGYIEFDMDLSGAHGGVNTNFYVTFPRRPNCGGSCYCDSGPAGGCAELDFIENNGNCVAQTAFHTDPSGGEKGGHNIALTGIGNNVHVRAAWSGDGGHLSVLVNGNEHGGEGLGDQLAQYGAVLYSSQWTGWVPGSCPGDGNLDASSFSVSNVKIHGRVVQGPEPKTCAPSPSPTPPVPTPPPGPGPTPGPSPSPPGVKHCSARGGCYCNCNFHCGQDDGSCCFGCCCNEGLVGQGNSSTVALVV
jgi:hypothetical protein